jgi:diguanylate cyclase (GGDEF)-like protein
VFLWAGLCEPRGTSLKLSPLVLTAYLLPLISDGASASDLASIGYALPIYLLVGEVLAWRTSHLRRVEQLAHNDPLTGLPNGTVFTAEVQRRCAEPEPVAVLFLDLGGFKQINDRLGHAGGDGVLVKVAGGLRGITRNDHDDLAGRLARDEFVVLLPDTDLENAPAIAGRLVQRLSELRAVDNSPIGCSVGVGGGRAMGSRRLLAMADEAMYTAKQTGTGVATAVAPAGARMAA